MEQQNSLYDEIKNLIKTPNSDTYYYSNFCCDNPLEDASGFIKNLYLYAGKTMLANYSSYDQDNADKKEFRDKHSLSAYYIGHLLARKLCNINDLTVKNGNHTFPFSYLWNLICLFHDKGYGLEITPSKLAEIQETPFYNSHFWKNPEDKKHSNMIGKFKVSQKIHSSIWFGPYCRFYNNSIFRTDQSTMIKHAIFDYYRKNKCISFDNGAKYRFPTYKSSVINRYFNYVINERKQIDHGIAGGYIFFDCMIQNYQKAFEKASRETDETLDYSEFIYNYLSFSFEQFPLFGYIADCIISHNIWNGKNVESKYIEYGLDCFIGNAYQKINLYKNPYLFLLGLCDTLEPVKKFSDSKHPTIEEILKSLRFEIDHNQIKICFLNNELNFAKYFESIKGLEDWLDVRVAQIGADANTIVIVINQ